MASSLITRYTDNQVSEITLPFAKRKSSTVILIKLMVTTISEMPVQYFLGKVSIVSEREGLDMKGC